MVSFSIPSFPPPIVEPLITKIKHSESVFSHHKTTSIKSQAYIMADNTPTNINHVEATQLLHETTQSAPQTASSTLEYKVVKETAEMEDNLPGSQNPMDVEKKKQPLDIRIDQLRTA
ncbi:hypothetical protein IFR05_004171 [Cadophora sp. M221]|nr:hypothetical protein IFR05_004171 [Cadophora sp. M221]